MRAASRPRYRTGSVVGLALFVLALFAAWTVRAFALAPLDRDLQPLLLRRAYVECIRLLLWVAPVLAYLRFVDRADAPSYLRLNTPNDLAGPLRAGRSRRPTWRW